MAFLPCVGFCDYVVMQQVGSGVGCPLSGRYMAKDMYRVLALFIAILLTGCANLKYQPERGLVKIEVQKLVPTEDCGGKGIRAYSARGSNKHH